MHLDLSSINFGIQEENRFSDALREVFPGAPEIQGGYMYCNDKPGLGVDVNEQAAGRWPYRNAGDSRGNDRRLDGTIVRP
jgi:mannonate dehydratase